MASVMIFLGLFFAAGVYSFWKQDKPKSVIVVLGFASAMLLAAGILRY
ncbi:hypothetical protein ACFYS8_27940 [Kitasatospora sp. NPDC004615]